MRHTFAVSSLDALDTAILNELQADGRVTATDLANRVGLSTSACLRRIRRLEETGVIDRYVMLVDPKRVGLTASVFVEITLSSQHEDRLDEFEAAVADCPGVRSCHLMAGDADYRLEVICEGVADYERIHRSHLAQLPHVARLRSNFAIRTVTSKTAYDI